MKFFKLIQSFLFCGLLTHSFTKYLLYICQTLGTLSIVSSWSTGDNIPALTKFHVLEVKVKMMVVSKSAGQDWINH